MERTKQKNGFTLVELLIAISLIAILSGVLFSVINPMGIQKKSRDSQRVSDLTKIKVALENYFSDNRQYPVSNNWGAVSSLSVLSPAYINVIPVDPKPSGTNCSGTTWHGYYYKSDGSKYVLATNFEVNTGNSCPYSGYCAGCTGVSFNYYATAN